ncbi:TIGR04282 family arsenosugar biosynthesis glycosyltransferase [Candidatus Woesearchaeota archaeon]|nr:TIGR04282 family arsenosugar biosynthesis glycosyltransferase [Candidatus Woesearchaeota archaeon]
MDALVLFAKYPEVGTVKKKIGEVIGMEKSARMCSAFIKDLVNKNSSKDYDLYLSFIGREHKEQYRELFPQAILYVQRGSNLGENMYCSFEDLLDDYNKVVILSCDVPQLSSAEVVRAFNALDSYDVVIGPAEDGGYFLLGLKRPANIFSGLNWGGDTLLEEQIRKIKDKKLSFVLLEKRPDVDTVEELKHMKKILKKEDAPETFAVFQELEV